MTRTVTAVILLAICAPLLAGCQAPPGGRGADFSMPYNSRTNDTCGALGTCAPSTTVPYPMRGNID